MKNYSIALFKLDITATLTRTFLIQVNLYKFALVFNICKETYRGKCEYSVFLTGSLWLSFKSRIALLRIIIQLALLYKSVISLLFVGNNNSHFINPVPYCP